MTRLARIAPEIPVLNLRDSLEYYSKQLAFEIASEWPDGQYAIVQRDDVAIHLFEDNQAMRPVGVHIFTSGIEELHDELRSRGAWLSQGVEQKPWGNRDFRVKDPSGNEIKFTEPAAE